MAVSVRKVNNKIHPTSYSSFNNLSKYTGFLLLIEKIGNDKEPSTKHKYTLDILQRLVKSQMVSRGVRPLYPSQVRSRTYHSQRYSNLIEPINFIHFLYFRFSIFTRLETQFLLILNCSIILLCLE